MSDDDDFGEPGEERGGLPIRAFASAAALESWLARQPPEHKGIWLKLAKKSSGIASVTVREVVDAGLCFGWIDGLISRYDDLLYLVRFTPRRARSKWSLVNVERVEILRADGRLRPGGLAEIDAAKADGRWDAAYPPASRMEPSDDFQTALKANATAATFFATLTGANRYVILYRLHGVRDPKRRSAAIGKWIRMLERGETVF